MKGTLFVDPGKTTGWAWLFGGDEPSDVLAGQDDPRSFLTTAHNLLFTYGGDVVCESFVITGQTLKKSRQPWSIEIIGALKHWIAPECGAGYEEQRPGDAKGLVTDDVLKHVDAWQPGKDHANDACRHMVLWLVREGRLAAQEVADAKL